MKFIDLFAGLGGFHVALGRLGHKCVFASEINKELAQLYEENFGIKNVYSDIKKVHEASIPPHDIMCAGFPCQPFSKAGKQLGIADTRGNFIEDFKRILNYHKPKYFILENVPNLRTHDREKSWEILKNTLENCGYKVDYEFLSPHEFGIPQIRKRIYIVGVLGGLKDFQFPKKQESSNLNIRTILDKKSINFRRMSKEQIRCINVWQKIIKVIPKEELLLSFPIWSGEFDANYPFEKRAPISLKLSKLQDYKGNCGKSLKNAKTKEEALSLLPSYARVNQEKFPDWKIRYIKQNREFYKKHKKIINPYLKELRTFPHTWQKLEWNCQNEKRDIFQHILQFRASGIRVKKSNYSPALVVNSTQLPIIGWKKRYLTKKEAARLQELDSIKLPATNSSAFKALGNAINVHIMQLIAEKLIGKKRGQKKKK
ncbi:MAG: DNA (cytosine-5-)-methyltransferase [Nanoarchaeota archaeon]|nr:DNA (cytosine-5-)-methyltransferase [Nanoarchaeota archaeon]